MNIFWDAYLASSSQFAGADDIITNLAKEREPGIEILLDVVKQANHASERARKLLPMRRRALASSVVHLLYRENKGLLVVHFCP